MATVLEIQNALARQGRSFVERWEAGPPSGFVIMIDGVVVSCGSDWQRLEASLNDWWARSEYKVKHENWLRSLAPQVST